MSRINTNISSLQAINRLNKNNSDLSTRLTRLSTGLKINTGKDAPAGLIASETLRSKINGIHQAIDNSTRANNVINTAEGALGEVSALLLEVQGLTNEAANSGALSRQEIEANQLQVDSILNSINRIANTTQFNGVKLLNGSLDYTTSGVVSTAVDTFQINAAKLPDNGYQTITVNVAATDNTGVTMMRLANEDGTWGAWKAFAAGSQWTLTAGYGTKGVTVQVKDAADNLSNTIYKTLSYTQAPVNPPPAGDIADPILVSATVPATTTTQTVAVALDATDDKGVTQVRFAGVKQGAGTRTNFIVRRLMKLPFVFNVTIRAPFRQLLSSAESLYDPSHLPQGKVQELLNQPAPSPAPATTPPDQPIQPPESEKMP